MSASVQSVSRKCGVCREEGDNVRVCSHAGAMHTLTELMNESSLDRALVMCHAMPIRYVYFALCRGFGVGSSGGREKLIELINAKFATVPTISVPTVSVPIVSVPTVSVPSVSVSTVSVPEVSTTQVPFRIEGPNESIVVRGMPSPMAFTRDASVIQLTTMLSEIRMYSIELSECLNVWKLEHLCDDVAFFDNLTISKGGLIELRQQTIKHIATRVLMKLLSDLNHLRDNIHGQTFDANLFINVRVNSVEIMNEYIRVATEDIGGVSLSGRANAYVLTLVQMQNCIRRRNYISELIEEFVESVSIPPLNVVVSCRDEEVESNCSVCFDDMSNASVVRTGCGHDFCVDCIGNWAKQRGMKSFIRCPCCRGEICVLTVGGYIMKVRVESVMV